MRAAVGILGNDLLVRWKCHSGNLADRSPLTNSANHAGSGYLRLHLAKNVEIGKLANSGFACADSIRSAQRRLHRPGIVGQHNLHCRKVFRLAVSVSIFWFSLTTIRPKIITKFCFDSAILMAMVQLFFQHRSGKLSKPTPASKSSAKNGSSPVKLRSSMTHFDGETFLRYYGENVILVPNTVTEKCVFAAMELQDPCLPNRSSQNWLRHSLRCES